VTRRQHKIHKAACSMIERYGRTTLQQVDQRIRELAEHGEDDTVALWRDIRTVVEHLLGNNKNGKSH
jgi:hypothetical protein